MANPPEELRLWDNVVVVGEITQSNRASLTWEVVADGQRAVAKLTCDAPAKVEPGFRVAAAVQRATGVLTGMPIPNIAGDLAVTVAQENGTTWTLAVLTFVEGDPLRSFSIAAAKEAGVLLARVHHCTRTMTRDAVAARLLDWFREVGDAGVRASADRLDALPLTQGVVYGDPSPELIRGASGEFALIDWGTPSFGPLAHDVVMWERHVRRWADGDASLLAAAFLDAYCRAGPCSDADFDALPLWTALWPA